MNKIDDVIKKLTLSTVKQDYPDEDERTQKLLTLERIKTQERERDAKRVLIYNVEKQVEGLRRTVQACREELNTTKEQLHRALRLLEEGDSIISEHLPGYTIFLDETDTFLDTLKEEEAKPHLHDTPEMKPESVAKTTITDTDPELEEREQMAKEIWAIMFKYYEGDEQKTDQWYSKPNEMLFGDSPKTCVLRGEGKTLLKWLKERGL